MIQTNLRESNLTLTLASYLSIYLSIIHVMSIFTRPDQTGNRKRTNYFKYPLLTNRRNKTKKETN